MHGVLCFCRPLLLDVILIHLHVRKANDTQKVSQLEAELDTLKVRVVPHSRSFPVTCIHIL
jgi:hypothetical protein